MPSYQNLNPPISLAPGDVGFSFNNEAFPGGAQAGSQFAISSFAGQPDAGRAVRWQTIFGGAPTAVNLVLQAAMADVDAEYQTLDTTTVVGGEARTVYGSAGEIFAGEVCVGHRRVGVDGEDSGMRCSRWRTTAGTEAASERCLSGLRRAIEERFLECATRPATSPVNLGVDTSERESRVGERRLWTIFE